MNIVPVPLHVSADKLAECMDSRLENASKGPKEPGVARFDLIQQADDKTRFLLVEVYPSPESMAQRMKTAHYSGWRETVKPLLAEPRSRILCGSFFSVESGWG